jgi:hypothetical protein
LDGHAAFAQVDGGLHLARNPFTHLGYGCLNRFGN